MNRAEGLIEANPDSAYVLLSSIDVPDNLNDKQFDKFAVLGLSVEYKFTL